MKSRRLQNSEKIQEVWRQKLKQEKIKQRRRRQNDEELKIDEEAFRVELIQAAEGRGEERNTEKSRGKRKKRMRSEELEEEGGSDLPEADTVVADARNL